MVGDHSESDVSNFFDTDAPMKLKALPYSVYLSYDRTGLLGKFGAKGRELTNYLDSLGEADNIDVSNMPKTTAST